MIRYTNPLQFICIFLFLFSALHTNSQSFSYDWTVAGGSAGIDDGRGVTTDAAKNIYAVGAFTGSVDFDPGPGVNTLTAVGTASGYLVKYDSNSNLQWAFQISASVSSSCNSVCCDTADNIYVIGEVNGISGDFDPGLGVASITSVGQTDVYIAKYTSSGQFVWLQQFGGALNEYARKIKAGKNNELVMTCNFEGTVDFDPGPGINNITSAGSSDVFIARFNTDGTLSWVKTIGNIGGNQGSGIGVDEQGSIYSAGGFSGTLDTDPDTSVTNFISTTGTASDGVLIKLDSNGIFKWSRQMSSNSAALINDVQPDGNNNIYLTGWFSGFADFDPGAGFDTMTNVSGIDVFLWKLNYNGNHIWAEKTGNSIPDFYDGRSVKMDKHGNPFVLGIFEGTADFDPESGISNLTGLGDFDIFVWGLNSNGKFLFCKSVGGAGKDVGYDLHMDTSNLYFTGFFNAQVDFDPWAGTNLITPASSQADFHINKWISCAPNAATVVQNICDTFFILNGQTYITSGIYTQNLTNISGCDSVLTLDLTLTNIDTGLVVSGNVITAVQSGASYQWYTCNGNWMPVTNATQQSFTVTQNGQYAVVITQNGCTDTSGCLSITGVGLNQPEGNPFCNFYPNPSSGAVYFDWNITHFNTTVYIYNSLGQLVQQVTVSGEPQTIIQLNQPPGIYVVKIITKDGVIIAPLVKQ